ncbi:MAG: NAD(P)-dependent oxidoreductase [Chloroflexi bacterium]|nr:NAD(P)-dependent oxidoreductase [Chloroflexota bacterium]
MKILLTGAFGNIGLPTLAILRARGHQVRCFDLPTQTNRKLWQQKAADVEVVWGDLRRMDDVRRAVHDRDVVIHLAFVVPKLSATGIGSEDEPEWARSINVGGTFNLIAAIKEQNPPAKLLFSSSLHVFGRTQHQAPPRTVVDPVQPVEHYSLHKITCEEMIKASGLPFAIFRLAAAMPVRMIMDAGMFDVPLDNRIEFVHSKDVALAIANALETEETWNKLWLIGGGSRCQFYYGDMAAQILEAMGVGMLPAEAFSTVPYSTDWLDTSESQRVLQFQQHTLDDYLLEMRKMLGFRRIIVKALRPVIRTHLLRQSPYYQAWRKEKRAQHHEAMASS